MGFRKILLVMMMNAIVTRKSFLLASSTTRGLFVIGWIPSTITSTTVRRQVSSLYIGEDGRMYSNRRIRRQPDDNNSNNNWGRSNDDDTNFYYRRNRNNRNNENDNRNDGWIDDNYRRNNYRKNEVKRRRNNNNNNDNNRYNDWNNNNNNKRNYDYKKSKKDSTSNESKINMKSFETAGLVHLYGLNPVFCALQANERDFRQDGYDDHNRKDDNDSFYYDDNDDDNASTTTSPIKPEAELRPYLFIQEQKQALGRSGDKLLTAEKVKLLAQERGIPIQTVDKGILNVLSGNRPHQGFVLRCGKLSFDTMSRIPVAKENDDEHDNIPKFWLVLDEIVDPQNFGALLRSAYFLFCDTTSPSKIGIVVCTKNSAPPSAIVSASSAGALELMRDTIFSTQNLPKTLSLAKQDGFRIIGTSSKSILASQGESSSNSIPLYNLNELPLRDNDTQQQPILLVLGSEGHGLRNLVAKQCTDFVKIPSSAVMMNNKDEDDIEKEQVDSLNVSVTGGILLWHLMCHHGIGNPPIYR